MQVDYPTLAKTIAALTEGETDAVALMATLACEIHHADDRFDWTGFYRVTEPGLLKIGPYQGGHGCLVIPFDRGVCGAAARTGETQLVPERGRLPRPYRLRLLDPVGTGDPGAGRVRRGDRGARYRQRPARCLHAGRCKAARGDSPGDLRGSARQRRDMALADHARVIGLAAEDLAYHRLEMLKRPAVVIRVEARLVPAFAELRAAVRNRDGRGTCRARCGPSHK